VVLREAQPSEKGSGTTKNQSKTKQPEQTVETSTDQSLPRWLARLSSLALAVPCAVPATQQQ